jgi:hypothetical protein
VKALPRFGAECLEERKTQEGRGDQMGLTARLTRHTHRREQSPEAGVTVLEPSSERQARWRKRQEGNDRGRPGTALRCGQIPEGRTLNVVVGRNKPTRHVVEQTVEGGWNAEDGT